MARTYKIYNADVGVGIGSAVLYGGPDGKVWPAMVLAVRKRLVVDLLIFNPGDGRSAFVRSAERSTTLSRVEERRWTDPALADAHTL